MQPAGKARAFSSLAQDVTRGCRVLLRAQDIIGTDQYVQPIEDANKK